MMTSTPPADEAGYYGGAGALRGADPGLPIACLRRLMLDAMSLPRPPQQQKPLASACCCGRWGVAQQQLRPNPTTTTHSPCLQPGLTVRWLAALPGPRPAALPREYAAGWEGGVSERDGRSGQSVVTTVRRQAVQAVQAVQGCAVMGGNIW